MLMLYYKVSIVNLEEDYMKFKIINLSLVVLVTSVLSISSALTKVSASTTITSAELISRNYTGNYSYELNNNATNSYLSANGKFAIYSSTASDIVPNDTNNASDVFYVDLTSNTTVRANTYSNNSLVGTGNSYGRSISENGRYITFVDDSYYYLKDMSSGQVTELSTGGLVPGETHVSNDGRFVLYPSNAISHGPVSSNNARITHTFMKDTVNDTITLLSKSPTNTPANGHTQPVSVSCDGSFIVLSSYATNLTQSDVNDNNERDLFIVDIRNGFKLTHMHSASNAEISGSARISCNGNYIGFSTNATNIVNGVNDGSMHFYTYNRLTQETVIQDRSTTNEIGNGNTALLISVSNDGSALFSSNATNLVGTPPSAGNWNAYYRNSSNNTTLLAALDSNGQVANATVSAKGISSDGKTFLFETTAHLQSSFSNGSVTKVYISKIQ